MNILKYLFFVSLSVFLTLAIVLGMALFDLVPIHGDMMQVLGAIDLCAFALFLKTYIRIYKYTHRD